MAVCSKCGVTVQDQNLQPDAEGKLVCRTCAGAWRAKSGQMSASTGRQEASPGFWMPLALAASALCVLLLIIAVVVGAGKSKLRKELEAKITMLDSSMKTAKLDRDDAQDSARRLSAQVQDLDAKLREKEQEVADLKSGKKPPKPGDKTTDLTGGGKTTDLTGGGKTTDLTGGGKTTTLTPLTSLLATDNVLIRKTGAKLFHVAGCQYAVKDTISVTLADAKKKKLKPCQYCIKAQ